MTNPTNWPPWQPIETAPKDGTPFLGYWESVEEYHVVNINRLGKCRREMDAKNWSMPDYWLPLPPSDQTNAAKGTDE